jgi:hypothetical protein
MLSTYGNLEDHVPPDPVIDNPSLNLLHKGAYGSELDACARLFDAFALRDVTVLSFVDMGDTTSQRAWLETLKEIYNSDATNITPRLMMLAVLYKWNAGVTTFPTDEYQGFLKGATDEYLGWDVAGNDNYLPFAILPNTTWLDDDNYYAHHFQSGLDMGLASRVGKPFTYIIAKNGAAYAITDKLYEGCAYNAKSTAPADPPAKSDLFKMDWPAAAKVAFQRDYIVQRLRDALAAPIVRVYPDSRDVTPSSASPARIAPSSKIRFTFSEKAVGAGVLANYGCTLDGGATAVVALSAPSAGDAGAIVSPNGMLATDLAAGKKETWLAQTAGLADGDEGAELAFDTVAMQGIHDGSGVSFALHTDNAALSYLVGLDSAAAAETPLLSATLVDLVGEIDERSTLLAGNATPVVAIGAHRRLELRLSCLYPGNVPPTAILWKPSGQPGAIDFLHNAADIDETPPSAGSLAALDAPGVYRLVAPPYANANGKASAALDCRFAVLPGLAVYADQLEGWGYFPREEGSPENCPEGDAVLLPDGSMLKPWTPCAGFAPTAALGSNLDIVHGADAGAMFLGRSYDYVFGSASSPGQCSGRGYIESRFSVAVTTPSAAQILVTDASTMTDLTIRSTGIGLALNNGPFACTLLCVEKLNADSTWTKLLAVPAFVPAATKPAYYFATLDWSAAVTLRVEKARDTADSEDAYRVRRWNASLTPPAFEAALLEIPVRKLPGSANGFASVSFGVLEDGDQDLTASFEYLRYAFADPCNLSAAGGFANLHRPLAGGAFETEFFRSPDIRVARPGGGGDPAKNDPLPGATPNTVSAVISSLLLPTGSTASDVPMKVRFCLADWPEGSEEAVLGFVRPGGSGLPAFPAYAAGGRIAPLADGAPSTSVARVGAAGAELPGLPWTFALSDDRKRRLALIACADAPYLNPPALVEGATKDKYFVADLASGVRVDPRCAVRQFLPDFYVRDHDTDDGSVTAGGWLSPDIILAPQNGDGTGYDPRTLDTTNYRYPAGFARLGESMNGYHSGVSETVDFSTNQGGSIKIKATDSPWTDTSSLRYFNRVWVRLSNRGIVPGPAMVQVFFLQSALRADFSPAPGDATTDGTRNDAWEQIVGDPTAADAAKYRQSYFQSYSLKPATTDQYDIATIRAIPALSGFSTPGSAKAYVLAEFTWKIAAGLAIPEDGHGCRAVFVNLPNYGGSSGVDDARRVDGSPLPLHPNGDPDGDIFSLNAMSNNVTVRNCDIVTGSTTSVVLTSLPVVEGGAPKGFRRTPARYVPTFGKPYAVWSLELDATLFPGGSLVLRVPYGIAKNAKPAGLAEIRDTSAGAGSPAYRFFFLEGKQVGKLVGIAPPAKGAGKSPDSGCDLFFLPGKTKKSGRHAVTLRQTANGKLVGGYTTEILALAPNDTRFVGDERIRVAFNVKKFPEAVEAIPFEVRAPALTAGFGIGSGMALSPALLVEIAKGRVWDGISLPAAPRAVAKKGGADLLGYSPRIAAAAVGRVLIGKKGAKGAKVVIVGPKGEKIGETETDSEGRYLIVRTRGEAQAESFEKIDKPYRLTAKASLALRHGAVHRDVDEPYFAMPDIVLASKQKAARPAAPNPKARPADKEDRKAK